MTEGVVWGKRYLKPIPPDPTLDTMNKKSMLKINDDQP